MKNLTAVMLLTISLVIPAFADAPEEEEVPPTPSRRELLDNMVNKPQRKISTVGPVPVNTVPPAGVVPGSGGLNAKELNVLVAPQGFGNPARPQSSVNQGDPQRQ